MFTSNGLYLWDNLTGTAKCQCITTGKEGNAGGTSGSAAQGIMTVKHPLAPNLYYIFTTDDANDNTGANDGFDYFTYNTTTNVLTGPTKILNARTTEGLSATFHSNSVDVWVTTQRYSNGNFYSYKITCSGVDAANPVISAAGFNFANSDQETRGGIEFSWDSKHLATAYPIWDQTKGLRYYDFDNATGQITNGRDINKTTLATGHLYDTEFSPDNKYLYASGNDGQLIVYDVSSGIAATIKASGNQILVNGTANGNHASIEMGGDGNLYRNSYEDNRVYKIVDTNNDGIFDTKQNAMPGINIDFIAVMGLPNMFLPPSDEPDIQEPAVLCDNGPTVNLSTNWICAGTNAEGAPALYSSNCGACLTDATLGTFDPSKANIGANQIIFTKCGVDDTIFITVNTCVVVCPDTSLAASIPSVCPGSNIDLSLYDGTAAAGNWSVQGAGANYPTLVGNIFATTSSTASGSYTVRYTLSPDPGGTCPDYAERSVIVYAKPNVVLNDQSICAGDDSVSFNAGGPYTAYEWSGQASGTNQIYKGINQGTYTVIVTNSNGCKDTASAELSVNPKPSVSLNNDTICEGDPAVIFDAGSGFDFYAWSDLGTGNASTTSGTTAGNYTVIVSTINGCSDTATATLTVYNLPSVSLADTSVCIGGSIQLSPVPNNFIKYEWHTGATTSSINYNAPNTTAWVKVTDNNGCSNTAFAQISNGDTLHVDFGGDKQICENEVLVLDAAQYGPFQATVTYTWDNVPGTSTKSITQTESYGVVVMDGKGCTGSDTIQLTVNPLPVVDLGNDTTVCFSGKQIFTYSLKTKYNSIQWSNGSIDTTVTQDFADALSVSVTNNFGCNASDTIVINEYCESTNLCFPNVTTPNGDGLNDNFIAMECPHVKIDNGNYKGFVDNLIDIHFIVINRWGIQIFESENVMPLWDGRFNGEPVSSGVYYWIVNYTDSAHQHHEQTGWVEVLN